MRTSMIVQYVREISASLGGVRPLAAEEELRMLYGRKDFVGMIRHIRATLRLDIGLRVGFVNGEGQLDAPAWINLPETMPPYGTREFGEMRLTMHVRRSFLRVCPFEAVIIAIAHELCHIILSGIHHRLHREEIAVDLAAMILGYRGFYRRGCNYTAREESPVLEEPMIATYRIGYLAREEVVLAADLMDFKP